MAELQINLRSKTSQEYIWAVDTDEQFPLHLNQSTSVKGRDPNTTLQVTQTTRAARIWVVGGSFEIRFQCVNVFGSFVNSQKFDSKKINLTFFIAWDLSDTKSHRRELSFWQIKDQYTLRAPQKSQENVMVEIEINRRSNDVHPHIWAPEYIRSIVPASELLYEGKGTGTLLSLYKLLRLRGPRDFGSTRVHLVLKAFWDFLYCLKEYDLKK